MQLSDLIIAAQNRDLLIEDWQSWQHYLSGLFCEFAPVDCAFISGAWSTTMAYAFAAGYQAALRQLYPNANPHKIYAFAVTERSGNSPKSIHSTLTCIEDHYLLNGEKSFITGIDLADTLFVAVWDAYHIDAMSSDRKNIKIVILERESKGMQLINHPVMSFLPELSHGSMQLKNVSVKEDQMLPGDGYEDYVKPFRTIEDIHVTSALIGHIFSIGLTNNWPRSLLQQLFSVFVQLRSISKHSAKDAGAHIALAGILGCFQQQLELVDEQMDLMPRELQLKWQQDKKVFSLASEARSKRTDNAWRIVE